MEEGKRQKQVAGLIQGEITTIFQRLGLNMMEGGMISISSVKITPDLLEARIYISLFKVPDEKLVMKKLLIIRLRYLIKGDSSSKAHPQNYTVDGGL